MRTDRKDAELLASLLLARPLTAVVVPPVKVDVARNGARTRRVSEDLTSARRRISKMLLSHGRVYTERRAIDPHWLAAQQFDEAALGLNHPDGLNARSPAAG